MTNSRNTSSCKVILYVLIIISAWDHDGLMPAALGQQQLQEGMAMGTSWAAQDLYCLSSPSKAFRFGWLQYPRAGLQFYVAVWYGGLDGSIVWAANRNTPAAANDTLQLTPDGNLLLVSASSRIIWQANTASKDVSALQILDSGNVVLLYKNGSFSWQSFSYPTDTLLPSQSFLVTSTLVSRLSAASLASGNFMFNVQGALASIAYISASTGNSIRNIWQAPADAVYVLVDAINNSAIAAQFLTNGIFSMYSLQNGTAYSQFVPSDYGSDTVAKNSSAVFRRLTLDPDGDLRMYGWDYTVGSWIVLSEAIWAFCALLSVNGAPACGPYGVCVDAPKPACACPPGFHPADIHDVTKGCSPSNLTLPTCQNNQSSINSSFTTYLVLTNTDFLGNDILSEVAISLSDCQSLCTSMCSCAGVIYNNVGAATCWLKSSLNNGYSPDIQKGSSDAYIKVQNSTGFPSAINPPLQSPTLSWINSSLYWSQASLQSNGSDYCGSPVVEHILYKTKPIWRTLVIVSFVIEAIELCCCALARAGGA